MKKILWIVEKQFDISPDITTWLEMAANLQRKFEIRLLTGFKKRNIQSDLLKNKIWYYNSLKLPVINRLSAFYLQNYTFSQCFYLFKPDILIFNTSNPILLRYANRLKQKYGTKIIFDVRTLPVSSGKIHRSIDNNLLKINLRYSSRKFNAITYITDEMKRFCTSEFNLPPHLSGVWTSGVNTDMFCPEDTKNSNTCFKLIYHGTISRKRGIENIVKALKLLSDINVKVELLAKRTSVSDLLSLADRIGVSDRIIFHDKIDYIKVPSWINRGHVGILPFHNWPGWNTSSPIKLFEYLSCAKPVIVTRIPAHTEVLGDKDFAYYSNSSSPEDLMVAIRLAYNDRSRLKILGKSARKFVKTHYTWEKQAHLIGRLIDRI